MWRARNGAKLLSADVPTSSTSRELRAYPQELLRSPLDVSSAHASFKLGTVPGPLPTLGASSAPDRETGGFEGLVGRDLSAGVVLASLLLALFWGAAHALSPGHGKTLVAAYLVGSRGTPRHALLLGLTVTVTHTAGVFALGLVTLAAAMALIFRLTPNRHQPAWSWLAFGATVSIVLWALVTLALGVFFEISNDFGDTYGPLAGIVALMIWCLLSAIAVLFGGAVAAQLEAVRSSRPAPKDPSKDRGPRERELATARR